MCFGTCRRSGARSVRLTGARTRAAEQGLNRGRGVIGRATSTTDETSASTRRMSPAGSSGLEFGAGSCDGGDARVEKVPGASERNRLDGGHGAVRRPVSCSRTARRSRRSDSAIPAGDGRWRHSGIVASRRAACQRVASGAVRVRRLSRDFPSLGPALADDAPEKHRAALARHAVIMASHVAANPIPHNTPCF